MEFVALGIVVVFVIWLVRRFKKTKPSLAERYYEGKKITGDHRFNSKITGVSFKSESGVKRQKLVKKLKAGEILYLIPDRHNKHDANAIMVMNRNEDDLGFLPSDTAADLKRELEQGKKFFGQVTEKTGGGLFKKTGINIGVYEVSDV